MKTKKGANEDAMQGVHSNRKSHGRSPFTFFGLQRTPNHIHTFSLIPRIVATKVGSIPALSAPKSRDSLRLRRRCLPLPKESRDFFGAPRCAISSAKKIASEPRFPLRIKWVKMVLAAEFLAIRLSVVKIASERQCAIFVHSVPAAFSPRRFSREHPENLLGLFITFNLARLKITFLRLNNLRNVNFVLVLKGIFGGSLKITLPNGNNPKG